MTNNSGISLESAQSFDFEHKVFEIEGCNFQYDKAEDRALFHVRLGDLQAVIGLDTLRDEFHIALDSPDDKLLSLVQRGLRFVKTIKPGDSIPTELLDGSASWVVEDRHIETAESRLSLMLANWLSGGGAQEFDREALVQLAGDPKTKERVLLAADKLAERLNLGEGNRQGVLDKVNLVARELAYIEALREHQDKLLAILDALQSCSHIYRFEKSVLESISRMIALIRPPLKRFGERFQEVDGQTGEILPLLANMDSNMEFIRSCRDEIHYEFMDWQEMVQAWKDQPMARSENMEKLMRRTYQFLATNYPQSQPWSLMTKRM